MCKMGQFNYLLELLELTHVDLHTGNLETYVQTGNTYLSEIMCTKCQTLLALRLCVKSVNVYRN